MSDVAHLTSCSLLRIGGSDAVSFLHNLITCNVEDLKVGDASFGALLTPQGKVQFDFFVQRGENFQTLDIDSGQSAALHKRLMFYKLRADVSIAIDERGVFAGSEIKKEDAFRDPRAKALGRRWYGPRLECRGSEMAWHRDRIALGMPHSGMDFNLGEVFPHDVLMDQFEGAGVDFSKGCYVGQEVVSRMQHRGTARNRVVIVRSNSPAENTLPEMGTPLTVDEKTIGSMGGSAGGTGLAIVRVDRLARALENGDEIRAGDRTVSLSRPAFARYEWPQ